MLHRSCSCPGGQKKTPVPRDRQTTLSQTPICRTHPASPPLRPYRWMTLRPARVSCAKGAPCTPALGPEPQRKSGTVHRGNPALPGVPAQAGTICPRLVTQKQNCQGGFPLTWCTPPRPCRPDLRPETDPSLLEPGDDGRGMVLLNSISVWEWADTGKNEPHFQQ